MLGGLHSNQLIIDMVRVWGHQLTALKLETISAVVPLHAIGSHCPNLIDLQLINAKLTIGNHSCNAPDQQFFTRLKLVYFFLIQYVTANDSEGNPITALHCVLRHATRLEGIQATGTPTFTDSVLETIVDKSNPMKHLRRFILTEAAAGSSRMGGSRVGSEQKLSLTSKSVMLLFDKCCHLQCVGDLRHWAIPLNERRQVIRKVQAKSQIRQDEKANIVLSTVYLN